MKHHFHIPYQTQFGENIELVLQSKNQNLIVPMNYVDGGSWHVSLDDIGEFTHYFYQKTTQNSIEKEWNTRELYKTKRMKDVFLYDYWTKANFPESYLSNRFFQYERKLSPNTISQKTTHLFHIIAPQLEPNHTLCIIGNCEILGNWNTEQAVLMNEVSFGTFECAVSFNESNVLQYKYGVYDTTANKIIYLESGENRIAFPVENSNQLMRKNDVYFQYKTESLPRKAGVSVPVFALRSKNSVGIGEFLDIKMLVDWAKQSGISLVQILPINDTIANKSWTDSYPYAAISTYALNPMYLSIESLPYSMSSKTKKEISQKKKSLNALESVNWQDVISFKFSVLKTIFSENSSEIQKDKFIQKFLTKNESWLKPYAVFCALRDAHSTSDFSTWKQYSTYNSKEIEAFFKPKNTMYDEVWFHVFMQYFLDAQLREAVEYAHEKNVKIKGDLPIGIYRHSVEAWKEPELFGMDFQAGAPPDDFAVLGQNWEFPTYNWEKMQENGFLWWKNRFAALENYFDAMRIDHILGFFRIWRIAQEHTQGILGYFYPAIPVTEHEFSERNIPFHESRFCEPFITKEYIQSLFSDNWEAALETYFEEKEGTVQFKDSYNTQRKITQNVSEISTQEKLLEIAANVLFLKEERENETVYHPRFNIAKTNAYQSLAESIQHQLYDLYVDYFYRRQEDFWKSKAMEKLPMLLQSTNMLICGEDLGLVPKCVPLVMDDLAILSLQVQRMPNTDILYHNPEVAPYLSVVTPATHDTSTVRQWWKEDRNLVENYYHNQLHESNDCPEECTQEIMETIIIQHLQSPAMLSAIPIQELMFLDKKSQRNDLDSERINIPAIFPHEWKYRMHLTLEELCTNSELQEKIGTFIQNSNRK